MTDEEFEVVLERIRVARTAIVEAIGPYRRGVSDTGGIKCPICGTGRLGFVRSGYNGHIHAECGTSDCVSWIE